MPESVIFFCLIIAILFFIIAIAIAISFSALICFLIGVVIVSIALSCIGFTLFPAFALIAYAGFTLVLATTLISKKQHNKTNHLLIFLLIPFAYFIYRFYLMYDRDIVLIDFIAPKYHSVCFSVISGYDEMFIMIGLLLTCAIIVTCYKKKPHI